MKQNIFHAAFFTPGANGRWGLPVLFIDEPGVAKTAFARLFGQLWDQHVQILSPALHGEGAFGVVPVPTKAGRLAYYPPDWIDSVSESGLVLVDEITSAGPVLQAPCMGLVADGMIGNTYLGPRVRVFGCCNPPELAANGNDLPAPLANRFGHMKWGAPTVEEHVAYMLGSREMPTPRNAVDEESRVMRAWPEAWATAVGLETAFLQAQPNWKNKCPKAGDIAASRAWPSDRTWEYATRARASAIVHKLDPAERDEYMSAFIGAQAYEHFAAFEESADIPAIADVADGKVKFTWEPKRLDRSAAIIAAWTALVTPSAADQRAERAARLWEALGKAHAYDITVPAAQALVKSGLHVSKDAWPVLAKLHPALKAAGVRIEDGGA